MAKMKCRQCEHFEKCRSKNIIIDATTSDDNWQNPFDHVYVFGLIEEVPSYCHYEEDSLDWINRVIIEDTKMNRKEFYPNTWIPCSERLPEEDGRYLCTFKDIFYGEKNFIDFGLFDDGQWFVEPLAWMPLPQPWGEMDGER